MSLGLRWSEPDASTIEAVRLANVASPLSYADVGATRGTTPDGWEAEAATIEVGTGPEAFAQAAAAVRDWRMFDLAWIRMPRREPPTEGETVAFASHQLGAWAINCCRVVYVLDEPVRSGFAYGTLATHGLAGEEQFLVERDPETDVVRFGIRKFSRLVHPMVRMAAPAVRGLQRRFTREALEALRSAVS